MGCICNHSAHTSCYLFVNVYIYICMYGYFICMGIWKWIDNFMQSSVGEMDFAREYFVIKVCDLDFIYCNWWIFRMNIAQCIYSSVKTVYRVIIKGERLNNIQINI